jgi:nucleoside 2-deoxyribosyltransferase
VFYEAGIAHALGKHVVPITQNAEDIPFDLRHHRYARYLNNGEGHETLRQELVDRFRTLAERKARANWA